MYYVTSMVSPSAYPAAMWTPKVCQGGHRETQNAQGCSAKDSDSSQPASKSDIPSLNKLSVAVQCSTELNDEFIWYPANPSSFQEIIQQIAREDSGRRKA